MFIKDNWLRLDFNNDGNVSIDDVRNSLTQFYEFLNTFDYLHKT